MLAVIGVLNESFTESLRGFYRLRQAFNTLYEIMEAEKKYMRKHFSESKTSLSTSSLQDKSSEPSSGVATPSDTAIGVNNVDQSLPDQLNGKLSLQEDGTRPPNASGGRINSPEDDIDLRTVTNDPVSFQVAFKH